MKFNSKIAVVLFASIATVTVSKAQTSFGTASSMASQSRTVTDASGKAAEFSAYTNLKGNPYFTKEWAKGDVIFKDGSVKKNVLIKYDEMQDNLYTQAPGDKMGEFDSPAVEFTIATDDGKTTHFATFPGNGKFSDKAFLQILADGNVKLIRKNAKSISEYKDGIGTAVVTREVVDNVDYYLMKTGTLTKIKKDKKAVLEVLGNKQPELEAYIKTNNLNVKKDEDLAKLITYYNTL